MKSLLNTIQLHPLQTTILFGLAILGLLIFALWYYQPARRHDRKIKRAIKRFGHQSLDNIWLPDGVDGQVFIDHLVLTNNDITVVSVKRYPGLIYGGEKLPNWTQVVNRRSHTFPNPLDELKLKIMAVQSIVPQVHVNGVTLFGTDSQFPTSKPSGVLTLEDINSQKNNSQIPPELLAGWHTLQLNQQTRLQKLH